MNQQSHSSASYILQLTLQSRGFTLIEVAIVLVIVALIIGGLLAPLSAQVEQTRRKATEQGIGSVHEAIIGFALSSGRLPCPDTDGDGLENPAGGVGGCTNNSGMLPGATLGIAAADGWGQAYRYLVAAEFADNTDGTSSGCGAATPGVSFELCAVGDIDVLDAAGGGSVAASVVAAIVSQAKNYGATAAADEAENMDNDRLLVSHRYTSAAGQEYDDIVSWISPNTLRAKMASAGILP
mgnify:FL=1